MNEEFTKLGERECMCNGRTAILESFWIDVEVTATKWQPNAARYAGWEAQNRHSE